MLLLDLAFRSAPPHAGLTSSGSTEVVSPLLAAAAADPFMQFLPILLMFGVIYFLILRPMSQQEKERKRKVEALAKGDYVVLTGGLIGRVSAADPGPVVLVEIADRVKVRVLRKDVVEVHADDPGKPAAPAGDKSTSKPAVAKTSADKASKDGAASA